MLGYTGCCVFSSFQLHIYRWLWHWSAWNFAWWYISVPDRSSTLLGVVPPGSLSPKFAYLTVNISKMVSCSVTCQLQLNINSTRGFKNVSHRVVPLRGVHPPIWQFCLFEALVEHLVFVDREAFIEIAMLFLFNQSCKYLKKCKCNLVYCIGIWWVVTGDT